MPCDGGANVADVRDVSLGPLSIAIDARELAGTPTGVGRYVAGVLSEWARTSFPHRVTLFLHAPPPDWIGDLPFVERVVLSPATVAGTWWEQVRLPTLLSQTRPDVLLAPAYTAPLRTPCPSVLIVHDVSFFAQPTGFHWREGLRRRLLTRASARRAGSVVTVSEFSASEVSRYLGIPRDALVLAPQGAPPWQGGPAADARAPMILAVGTLFNRRHIPELLRAVSSVRSTLPDAHLVLIGGNHTRPRVDLPALIRSTGLDGAVTWHTYVSDDELVRYYQSARVFAFLSDYEGFAMTPMEAAAHGVPSVLLDTEVAREVYGEAAVRIPLDPTGTVPIAPIAEALSTLLTDASAHAQLVDRARARLDTFTWSATATALRAALERTAARSAR